MSIVTSNIRNSCVDSSIPFQEESDDENPFADDIGGNVVSFNDMDPQKMGTGGKSGGDKPF